MVPLALGLLFGAIGAAGVLIGAFLVLRAMRVSEKVTAILVAFAAGTLIATALQGLVPEAAEALPLSTVAGIAVLALVAFFVLEKLLLWWRSLDSTFERHRAAGVLILVGDTVHNVVDGVVLGAAFVADPWLGVTVGIAVLAHEVPQEVGDFVLLLEAGLSARRALVANLLSAAAIFPGVVVGYLLAEAATLATGVALAFAAGGFLYVALVDLVPELHRRGRPSALWEQLLPMIAGIVVIAAIGQLEP